MTRVLRAVGKAPRCAKRGLTGSRNGDGECFRLADNANTIDGSRRAGRCLVVVSDLEMMAK